MRGRGHGAAAGQRKAWELPAKAQPGVHKSTVEAEGRELRESYRSCRRIQRRRREVRILVGQVVYPDSRSDAKGELVPALKIDEGGVTGLVVERGDVVGA